LPHTIGLGRAPSSVHPSGVIRLAERLVTCTAHPPTMRSWRGARFASPNSKSAPTRSWSRASGRSTRLCAPTWRSEEPGAGAICQASSWTCSRRREHLRATCAHLPKRIGRI